MRLLVKIIYLVSFLWFVPVTHAASNDSLYVFLTATVHHNSSGTDRSQFYSPVFQTTRGALKESRDR